MEPKDFINSLRMMEEIVSWSESGIPKQIQESALGGRCVWGRALFNGRGGSDAFSFPKSAGRSLFDCFFNCLSPVPTSLWKRRDLASPLIFIAREL